MEEPPTWLITYSPPHGAASSLLPIAEISRLGTACICLQMLQFFFSQLLNRPVALWYTWRCCVKAGVHRLETLCFHKCWSYDIDLYHEVLPFYSSSTEIFCNSSAKFYTSWKSLSVTWSIHQLPKTSGAGCKELLVETQELKGKKQQRVFEKNCLFPYSRRWKYWFGKMGFLWYLM